MKKYLMIVGLFMISFLSFAQEDGRLKINDEGFKKDVIRPLKIGDKVPDISFTLVNSPRRNIKLSDFDNELIILDFWATWCTSCIVNFPHAEALQSKFPDKLKIILVNAKNTGDNESRVESFFKKRVKLKKEIKLPSAINDTIADRLFAHKMIPHYVWIKNRQVVAITSSSHLTAENIETAINGTSLAVPSKKDNYDSKKPLFINGNGGEESEKYIFRSILTGYTEGLPCSKNIERGKNGLIKRVYCTNAPILMLLEHAYPEMNSFTQSRMIFDVADPSRLISKESLETWKNENTFCYELILPPTELGRALQNMQQDIYRYFKLRIKTERRKISCLVLKQIGQSDSGLSKGGDLEENLMDEDDGSMKYFKNYSIDFLVEALNRKGRIPVFDETNFVKKLDMDLVPDLENLDSLNKSLYKYGFTLVEDKREMEVLIITDK